MTKFLHVIVRIGDGTPNNLHEPKSVNEGNVYG